MLNCVVCGKNLVGKQSKFCSGRCKNFVHQSYDAQQARGRSRKIKLIELAGGCCSVCGYDKNYAVLCFHHVDGFDKEIRLDLRSLSNHKSEVIMSEFEKCILLCANCHTELHHPECLLDGAGGIRTHEAEASD